MTPTPAPARHASVVVYGATPAGVIAAATAARMGATVILIEPSQHLGGLSSSGLVTAEFEHMLPECYSGLALDVFRRIGAAYGFDEPLFHWEPHVAEQVLTDLVDEAGVTTILGSTLHRADTAEHRITDLRLDSGATVTGDVFIDCSYEGDLMAYAGVSYTYGRESRTTYGEDLAGIVFVEHQDQVADYGLGTTIDEIIPISPYLDGHLLPGFVEPDGIIPGHGDNKTSNYHFRITLSTASDRIPVPQPADYEPERFLPYARYFRAFPETTLRDIIDVTPHPSGQYRVRPDGRTRAIPGTKWEMNNRQDRPLSLGHLGGQFGYPDADPHERRRIYNDHIAHNQGLLHFLTHDSSVPAHLRAEMQSYGLPADEYTDNQNWPYALYVREARRMIGDSVLTQRDVFDDTTKPDVIALASHWVDSHYVQRVAVSTTGFRGEGRIWRPVTATYHLPYRAILPKRSEITNLLVPVCLSASRVAFSSIRVEPQWMALAQAAGTAAVLSEGHDLHDVSVAELQHQLNKSGVEIPH